MKATIWHNPKCGTSRKTLAILEEAGADVTVIEYLKTPPTRETLVRLYGQAGMTPREGLRARQDEAAPFLNADDETILDAMIAQPILIERPLVETARGVRLCRPQDKVHEII